MAKTRRVLGGFLIILSALFMSALFSMADDAMNDPDETDAPEQTTSDAASIDSKSVSDFWSVADGMILSELKPAGEVVGSKEDKMMLGEGDIIFLNSTQGPLAPETEWVVFRNVKKIRHPKTGTSLGSLIRVVGLVKILQVDNQSITAQVVHSNDPILKGDQIVSLESLSQPVSSSEESSSAEKGGTIVEAKDDQQNIGLLDVVYIDRGKRDGVKVGDRFEVRQGRVEPAKSAFPRKKVGTLLILSVQDQTATAKVIEDSDPILKGDLLLPPPLLQ